MLKETREPQRQELGGGGQDHWSQPQRGRRQHGHLRQSLRLGEQLASAGAKGKGKLQNIKGEACRTP